ncbi:methyltransferase [Ignavibacterium album]|uniref:methyltransferase n=1 Tax=Ignavibacterium album TaxID=591197 RepID=UPI0035BA4EE7
MKPFKRILFFVLSHVYKIYSSKIRNYKYDELKLKILPGVFHPGFFFSTKFLISHLSRYDLKSKAVLELGAGSGLISVYCAEKGALVTASDISFAAINNVRLNAELNECNITVVHSDLFDSIPRQQFDFIVINPPYFAKDPENESEYAWFCGKEFQYFEKLFRQIGDFIFSSTIVLMVLSEDCEIEKIKSIAGKNKIEMNLVESKKFFGEENFIFQLHHGKN